MIRRLLVCAVAVAMAGCAPPFMQNASISVEGRVESDDGTRLRDVRLHVRESRFDITSESFSSSSVRRLDLEDGTFRVRCSRCKSMQLAFSKKGFYSEDIEVHIDDDEREEVDSGRVRNRRVEDLDLDDLRVVLRSAANAAQLTRYEGTLETASGGPVRVLALRRDAGSRGVTLDLLDKPPSSSAELLPGYVRLLARTTDGALAAEPRPDTPGSWMKRPLPAVLDFSQADGGVIFHRMVRGNYRKAFQRMGHAPETGYAPTRTLDHEEVGGYYLFYCRVGDLYGTGLVVAPSFGFSDDGEEVVQSHIELRVNPTGDRNVQSP